MPIFIRRTLVAARTSTAQRRTTIARLAAAATIAAALYLPFVLVPQTAHADTTEVAAGQVTSTNKAITPEAAAGAVFEELDPQLASTPERRPGGAAAVAVSPDGNRLAIMTSGFDVYYDAHGALVPEASTQYVFLTKLPAESRVRPRFSRYPIHSLE